MFDEVSPGWIHSLWTVYSDPRRYSLRVRGRFTKGIGTDPPSIYTDPMNLKSQPWYQNWAKDTFFRCQVCEELLDTEHLRPENWHTLDRRVVLRSPQRPRKLYGLPAR